MANETVYTYRGPNGAVIYRGGNERLAEALALTGGDYDAAMRQAGMVQQAAPTATRVAVPQSGNVATIPGAREAHARYGVAPPVRQKTPWATQTAVVYQTPGGGTGVQNLVGYPSPYPHVLNGVPARPGTYMAPWVETFRSLVNPGGQTEQSVVPKRSGRGGGGGGTRQQSQQQQRTPGPLVPAQQLRELEARMGIHANDVTTPPPNPYPAQRLRMLEEQRGISAADVANPTAGTQPAPAQGSTKSKLDVEPIPPNPNLGTGSMSGATITPPQGRARGPFARAAASLTLTPFEYQNWLYENGYITEDEWRQAHGYSPDVKAPPQRPDVNPLAPQDGGSAALSQGSLSAALDPATYYRQLLLTQGYA